MSRAPLDDALLREAFALLALRGVTYEQAMADRLRSRIVMARAAALRSKLKKQQLRKRGAHEQQSVLEQS